MIRSEGLTKYYGGRAVVRDVSFEIEDGEIVGFLGRNGAGKTTVLRMLAGLLSPSSGRVLIDGTDLLEDPLAMRWRIGFLPESPPLYDEMDVKGYLAFAAQLRGRDTRRVDEVLALTDLTEVAGQEIGTLSHGYRQRLGIAQAIVHDPSLVVLDEPINGLDPKQIVEMRELILRLKEQHTVLVSSHILSEIQETCDRIIVLREGRVVFSGTESELRGRMHQDVREVSAFVLGERAAVEAALRAAKAVAGFTLTAEEGGVHVAATMAEGGPEILAKLVVEAGLGLHRLEPKKGELERLFIELTGTET